MSGEYGHCTANFFPVTVEVVVPDPFETTIPDPGQVVVAEAIPYGATFYENGFFRPGTGGEWKVKKTRVLSSESQIITYGVPSDIVGHAKLFDDDGRNLIDPQLPRLDLVNEQMKAYFRPSFIEVTDAVAFNPTKLIVFKPNEDAFPENTILDDARDLVDTPSLWVCTVVAAYQGRTDRDQDPENEGELIDFGETSGFDGNDQFSAVYVEGCRETYRGGLDSPRPDIAGRRRQQLSKFIVGVASHEMGHHPGTQIAEEDHAEGKLMSSGLNEVDRAAPESSFFSPLTTKRFRKSNRWAD